MQAGHDNQQVIAAVDALTRKVDEVQRSLQTFQATLPDAYMPRRESEQRFTEIRDRHTDYQSRLVSLEEYRLSETRRAAEASAALQAQIQSAALAAVKDDAQTRQNLERDITQGRTDASNRTIDHQNMVQLYILGAALAVCGSIIGSAILHALFH